MHTKSQISHDVRSNVTNPTNSEPEPRCGICWRRKGHYDDCLTFTGIENVDFVKCKICAAAYKSLARHVAGTHGLTKEQYLHDHGGQIKCDASTKKYSDQNKLNCDWINRANARGDDLTEYKMKMAAAVSDAIMNNPKERARRSKLLGELNKTPEFRERASRTARITSKRPEILAQRSHFLANWRRKHPEKCQEIIGKLIASKGGKSKPQRLMYEKVYKLFPDYEFKQDAQIWLRNVKILKTRRPLIDIMSRKKKVAIEIDGPYHFKSIHNSPLKNKQLRDQQVNKALPRLGYCLIRVSYDAWKNSGEIHDEHFEQIQKLIENPQSGVHFFGNHHAGVI